MSAQRLSILLVLAAGVLFGTAGTAQALGPTAATPLGVGVLRIAIGAFVLVTALPLRGGSVRRLPRSWASGPMLVTSLAAATYQVCFFAGVNLAGVALGTLVAVGSGPIFAGLVGWMVLGQRPMRGWLVATAISVVGLGLLAAPDVVAGDPLGLLLAMGAGLCIAGYNVAARVQLDRGASSLEVTAGSFALGGLLLLPLLVTQPLDWLVAPSGVLLALYLGVATMAVANLLLARGMRDLASGPVATLMLADPVVATALGVVVLGERLAPAAAVGVLLVLGGLLLQAALAARGGPHGARHDAEPVTTLSP
jgi:DME family drug/metabolite transporter